MSKWWDKSWNPVTGCTKVSPACDNCYAERMAYRLAGRNGYPERPGHFDVVLHPARLPELEKIASGKRVFVCSMSDLFHERVPIDFIRDVFFAMARQPRVTFMLLTKRPDRMQHLFGSDIVKCKMDDYGCIHHQLLTTMPLPNVWLGVTAEDQARADERIPLLLQTPAAVRFVSYEPMLGPVDFRKVPDFNKCGSAGQELTRNLWVIAGGETGVHARHWKGEWLESLYAQCQAARVPFFFKQAGNNPPAGFSWPDAPQEYPA